MSKHEVDSTNMPAFILTFFDDETLYSHCARFHNHSGNRLASMTGEQLFGSGAAAMLHDFPNNLANFARRTNGKLGDENTLARERTLLKFYAPYHSADRVAVSALAMAGAGIDRLKFRLGLPPSRVGAAHPLKACRECMNDELDQLGVAYWHLLYQHPAVWVCAKHGALLMWAVGKSRTRNKLQWVLPDAFSSSDWERLPARYETTMNLLIALNNFADHVTLANAFSLDKMQLRQCYLAGVKKSGWLTKCGSVRLKAVREAFLDQYIGLLGLPGFDFIAGVDRADGGFVGRLLRSCRGNVHPSKHLMLAAFLFKSPTDFLESYEAMGCMPPHPTLKRYAEQTGSATFQSLVSLVKSRQISLAEAARSLNLPYDVARYWLRRADVQCGRKPTKTC